jgi:L-malate glycosyltransferase
MKIGIAGPISLAMLALPDGPPDDLPTSDEAPIIASLVNALIARGHQVVVFTLANDITSPYTHVTPNLVVCAARGRNTGRSRDLYRVERSGLLELMRSHPVDIINAEWSYTYAWAALDSGRPTLVTVRDHARTVLRHAPDAFRLVRLAMNAYVLHRATHLSANSEYLMARLTQGQQRKTRVVPNFYSPLLGDLSKERQGLDTNFEHPVIASVVNGFGRRKNVPAALRGFSVVRRQIPTAELHLIGEGMGPAGPARAYAQSAGLTAGVRFMGRLPYLETMREIAAAAVLLHPALEESFGMTVLEAMVLGTPVVAGRDSGNIPSLLDQGRAGILCDVRAPRRIAEAVLLATRESEQRQSLIRRAREVARERFSEEVAVSAYLQYYQDVLARDRP